MSAVEFARWATEIENARLQFVDMAFGGQGLRVDLPPEGIRLDVPGHRSKTGPQMEARFLDLDSHVVYRIGCSPVAFRLLDEHGLVEMWNATNKQGGRPGSSTFRVRNHAWSQESELSFLHGTRDGYSYLIATDWECLELVTMEAPLVQAVESASASMLPGTTAH